MSRTNNYYNYSIIIVRTHKAYGDIKNRNRKEAGMHKDPGKTADPGRKDKDES